MLFCKKKKKIHFSVLIICVAILKERGFNIYLQRIDVSLGLDIVMGAKHSGQRVISVAIYVLTKHALYFIVCPDAECPLFLV
jgi:hypothetical protein